MFVKWYSCSAKLSPLRLLKRLPGLKSKREANRGLPELSLMRLSKGGRAVMDYLDKLADFPRVKGVRRIIQNEDDLDFCLRPGFLEGVDALSSYGYSFDICIDRRHMDKAIALASKCSEVHMVLDHIGKPNIAAGEFQPWASQLKALSGCPNVWCKMSGVVTEAEHDNWRIEDIRPYVLAAIEAFGFERTMFGGDWPVVTQAASYCRWVGALADLLSFSTSDELEMLFYRTASEFYRLA